MKRSAQYPVSQFARRQCAAFFELALICALTILAQPAAQAQTFHVLHSFTGGSDGASPRAGLTQGGTGTLYGTTAGGGSNPNGYGVVYKLSLHNSSWLLAPVYEFTNTSDGFEPMGGITIGPGGVPFGTANNGHSGVLGTVFSVTPPLTVCKAVLCYWNENTLLSFAEDGSNGAGPIGNLVFDRAGNMYGVAVAGGSHRSGVAFELTPSGSGWTQTILHNFGQGGDGISPTTGLAQDAVGNLYGTTAGGGGASVGTVYELTPSGGGWTETVLYDFPNGGDGYQPDTGVIVDARGNLYGTTSEGGSGGAGTVFELSPSGGQWTYTVLYSFSGRTGPVGGTLTMDTGGNLYGLASAAGADGFGMVFKLTNAGGSWTLTDLFDFNGATDGRYPSGGVLLDGSGNLLGTAYAGGTPGSCQGQGCGTIWEITP